MIGDIEFAYFLELSKEKRSLKRRREAALYNNKSNNNNFKTGLYRQRHPEFYETEMPRSWNTNSALGCGVKLFS
jgi:hypothetical protein